MIVALHLKAAVRVMAILHRHEIICVLQMIRAVMGLTAHELNQFCLYLLDCLSVITAYPFVAGNLPLDAPALRH